LEKVFFGRVVLKQNIYNCGDFHWMEQEVLADVKDVLERRQMSEVWVE